MKSTQHVDQQLRPLYLQTRAIPKHLVVETQDISTSIAAILYAQHHGAKDKDDETSIVSQ